MFAQPVPTTHHFLDGSYHSDTILIRRHYTGEGWRADWKLDDNLVVGVDGACSETIYRTQRELKAAMSRRFPGVRFERE